MGRAITKRIISPDWRRTCGAVAVLTLLASSPAMATSAPPPTLLQPGSGRIDLDGDGALDCWRLSYDGGNAYGWWTMKVQAPCATAPLEVRLGGSFADFLAIGALPKALVDRSALSRGLLKLWFGPAAQRALTDIDGSFATLIREYGRGEERGIGEWREGNHDELSWSPGPPTLPPIQVVVLSGPEEESLATRLARRLATDDERIAAGPALLVYFAQNHHRLTKVARAGTVDVYATDHAIALFDTQRQRSGWPFVSTNQSRLRSPSIGRVVARDSIVAVEVSGQRPRLVVIDPRSGRSMWRPLRGAWSLDERGLHIGGETIAMADLNGLFAR